MVVDDFLTVDDLPNLTSSSSKFYIGWYLVRYKVILKEKNNSNHNDKNNYHRKSKNDGKEESKAL